MTDISTYHYSLDECAGLIATDEDTARAALRAVGVPEVRDRGVSWYPARWVDHHLDHLWQWAWSPAGSDVRAAVELLRRLGVAIAIRGLSEPPYVPPLVEVRR